MAFVEVAGAYIRSSLVIPSQEARFGRLVFQSLPNRNGLADRHHKRAASMHPSDGRLTLFLSVQTSVQTIATIISGRVDIR